MAQKPVLGKGLASLLPPLAPPILNTGSGALAAGAPVAASSSQYLMSGTTSGAQDSHRDRHMGISMANIDDIQANHFQPRRDFDETHLAELAQSIKVSGIIQPLVVRKGNKEGFELIAGERRLRAAKLAGLKQVPIVIRKSTDRETLELALVENIQRQNLNCIDEALAYFQLIEDFSLTQEEVADRVGKDRASVANHLRLLRLPEIILSDLKKQVLSFGHGKALLGLDDNEVRIRARNQVIERRLSVRETETLVEVLKHAKKQAIEGQESIDPSKALSERFAHLSRDLGRHWSTKIEVKGSENRGKIVIHYSSRQDLDRIIEGMQIQK